MKRRFSEAWHPVVKVRAAALRAPWGAAVVGHTIHRKVNKQYDGKVFAIDVKHPEDHNENFPVKRSEGLLIDQGRYDRVLDDGERIEL